MTGIGLEPIGDCGILVRVGEQIDDDVQARVRALSTRLEKGLPVGAIEIVPAFTSLAVYYDPTRTRYADLSAELRAIATNLADERTVPASTLAIAVRYGGADGPDLTHVAQHAGLAIDEVIRLHTSREYRVHMIGFAPGFPYLGGLDPRIACPRRDTPRTRVPAGSVGIGGDQAGVYSIESPGGWQIIGRTDLKLFDPQREPAALLKAGDRVRFTVAKT